MSFQAFNMGCNVLAFNKDGKKYGMVCAWATQVDYDKFTIHKEVYDSLKVYCIEKDSNRVNKLKVSLLNNFPYFFLIMALYDGAKEVNYEHNN